MLHGRNPAPIVATYKSGQEVDFEVKITAHHNGHMVFHLCDLDACGTRDIDKSCFQKKTCYQLERVKMPECEDTSIDTSTTCGPIDEAYPNRWYLPCLKSGGSHVGSNMYGGKDGSMRYKLPAGVTCKHCVVQWQWWSANACHAPGVVEYFRKYNPFQCENGKSVYSPNLGGCEVPEEFASCADVTVTASGGDNDNANNRNNKKNNNTSTNNNQNDSNNNNDNNNGSDNGNDNNKDDKKDNDNDNVNDDENNNNNNSSDNNITNDDDTKNKNDNYNNNSETDAAEEESSNYWNGARLRPVPPRQINQKMNENEPETAKQNEPGYNDRRNKKMETPYTNSQNQNNKTKNTSDRSKRNDGDSQDQGIQDPYGKHKPSTLEQNRHTYNGGDSQRTDDTYENGRKNGEGKQSEEFKKELLDVLDKLRLDGDQEANGAVDELLEFLKKNRNAF